MLTYKKFDNLNLVGYSNSDLAECLDDFKSSRYIFMLAGDAVSWSVKHTLTASFTMQAKFITCQGTATYAIWLRNLISVLQIIHSTTRPLTIYYDNKAVVFFTKNNKSFSRSKYLELKYLIIRDLVKKWNITIKHIDIESIMIDPLGKAQRPMCFTKLVENMDILSSFDVLRQQE